MLRTVLEYVGLGVAILSGITGVWALISTDSFPLSVLAIFVCLVASVALVIAVVAVRRLDRLRHLGARETRWTLALPKLSQAISALASFSAISGDLPEEDKKRQFSDAAARVCLALSGAYTQVVGQECRVTLKETFLSDDDSPLGGPQTDLVVVELRSTASQPARTVDWVSENSDFDRIYRSDAKYFFSNDLPSQLKRGYRNSHWTPERLKQWAADGSYPYRSTIVWPVRALVESADGELAWSQVGFLCVDCASENAFDEGIDVAYGDIVARSLYTVWPKGPLPVSDEIPSEVVA
jgi:hypothetical protein